MLMSVGTGDVIPTNHSGTAFWPHVLLPFCHLGQGLTWPGLHTSSLIALDE
jgi:hypothetical protein